jgi:NADH:ubiquinone oxidoreductase subunit H
MAFETLGWQGLVILVIFGLSLLIATYCTYAERVIAAFLQDRVGPDRAGPLRPAAAAGRCREDVHEGRILPRRR